MTAEFKNVKIVSVGDNATLHGDVYPRDAMEKAIANNKTDNIFGQMGNPPSFCHVDLLKISHVVKDIRLEGDAVMATVKTLNTSSGETVRKLIEMGASTKFAVSGVGFISPAKEIESFQILSVNIVADHKHDF